MIGIVDPDHGVGLVCSPQLSRVSHRALPDLSYPNGGDYLAALLIAAVMSVAAWSTVTLPLRAALALSWMALEIAV
ncbi:hypothetical protein C8K36_106214 [Rhodococcus sp. OK519]|nr:hypothetical protein C8K36_106214 [Rhodococcus sp. OK519]